MSRNTSRWCALVVAGLSAVIHAQAPPAPRQLRANGADLSYVEQGRGAPVVFVHGAVGDLRFWEPQREAFARQHRFVAYTYRYHGTAPWTDGGKLYSSKTHAADLAAFISGLKAGPVHLVGLSYGGLLAAMVAISQPELIQTLTLAEPALFALLQGQPDAKPALDEWGKGALPMIEAMKAGDSLKATKLLSALVHGEPPDSFDKLPPELRQMLTDNARTLPLLFGAETFSIDCESLRGVKAPTLLVHGERTPAIFSKTNEAVARCIPGSRAAVVSNASHTMSYQNASGFNRTVLDFISKPR
jgi:pimeloyl-ACP methyl ester carboxylesterase